MSLTYVNAKMIEVPAELDQLIVRVLSASNFNNTAFSTNDLEALNAIVQNLTATNSQLTNITADSIVVNSLTPTNLNTENLGLNYNVTTITNVLSYEFIESDNSKSFHFDTTSNSITAVFSDDLTTGFNVSILNTGTGTVYVSTNQIPIINSPAFSNLNAIQNTGVFVYKVGNTYYGVGVFE